MDTRVHGPRPVRLGRALLERAAAIGKRETDPPLSFHGLVESRHEGVRFDWEKIDRAIAQLQDDLPDRWDYPASDVSLNLGRWREARETRSVAAKVAGPAALLVAELHKIDDRKGSRRAVDKDALDVFRLLRGTEAEDVAERMKRVLDDARSRPAAERSLRLLQDLFGRAGIGSVMAARAAEGLIDEAEVRLSCEALSQDLLALIERGR